MTDLPFDVRLDSTELGLAIGLSQRGLRVALHEPDPDDFRRVTDMLSRATHPPHLTAQPIAADMILGAAPDAAASLDWKDGSQPFVVITLSPDQALVEYGGGAEGAVLAKLAGKLNAPLIEVRDGQIPPSKRLAAALGRALEEILLVGSTPAEIDAALEAAGFAEGPFAAQDRNGIDRVLADRVAVEGGNDLPLFARAVSEGRLGRAIGVGWYRYPGNGGPVEDPLVEDMAEEEAHFAGIARQDLSASGIVDRVRRDVSSVMQSGDLTTPLWHEICQITFGCDPRVFC